MNVAVSMARVLLYSASNYLSQFAWFDRAGKPQGIVGEPGEYMAFRLSPDGHRIIASRRLSGSVDLWRMDVDRGVVSRFTSRSKENGYPIWSPDGGTIMFRAGQPWNLFRKESSGAGDEQRLTQSSNTQDPTDWSRRRGAWFSTTKVTADSGLNLWVLPVTREGKPSPDAGPRPYLRTPFSEGWGRFSPEAPPRWVAYQADETGRYEVYIQAFPEPRGKFQISTNGGQYPQWGVGGRELFYMSPRIIN